MMRAELVLIPLLHYGLHGTLEPQRYVTERTVGLYVQTDGVAVVPNSDG